MRTTPIATLLAFMLFGFDAAAVVPLGTSVPDFQVEGSDGAQVRLADLAGRYVLVVYEDRASANQNVKLKQRLWSMHRRGRLDDRMAVMPIADVRAFHEWPASQYARKAIESERKLTGRTLFADFTGEAGRAIDAHPGRSTLVFLDPDGRVIWSGEGPLRKAVVATLIRLVVDKAGVAAGGRERPAKTGTAGRRPDRVRDPGPKGAQEVGADGAGDVGQDAVPVPRPPVTAPAEEPVGDPAPSPDPGPAPDPEPIPEPTPDPVSSPDPGPAPVAAS